MGISASSTDGAFSRAGGGESAVGKSGAIGLECGRMPRVPAAGPRLALQRVPNSIAAFT